MPKAQPAFGAIQNRQSFSGPVNKTMLTSNTPKANKPSLLFIPKLEPTGIKTISEG